MKMGTATVSNDELAHAIERDEELAGVNAPILTETRSLDALRRGARSRQRRSPSPTDASTSCTSATSAICRTPRASRTSSSSASTAMSRCARLKGEGRPVMPEGERAEIISAIRGVTYVTIFRRRESLAAAAGPSARFSVQGDRLHRRLGSRGGDREGVWRARS